MGFIRGVLAVFISVLLLLILFVGNGFLALTLSLKYENVHNQIKPVIKDTIEEELGVDLVQEIENEISSFELNCEGSQEDYIFYEGGYTISLSCDSISQGPEAIVDKGIDSLIKQTYYKEYTCDFWKCFKEDEIPLFLVSEYSRDYWRGKFYLSFLASLILIGLLFILFKKKSNTLLIPGILLIAASIPFLRIGTLMSLFGDKVIFEILSVFFSKAHAVFKISFFTGLGLVIIGLVFRLFMVGFKISNLFHRDSNNIGSKKSKK